MRKNKVDNGGPAIMKGNPNGPSGKGKGKGKQDWYPSTQQWMHMYPTRPQWQANYQQYGAKGGKAEEM